MSLKRNLVRYLRSSRDLAHGKKVLGLSPEILAALPKGSGFGALEVFREPYLTACFGRISIIVVE